MSFPTCKANSANCLALQTSIVTVQMKTTWIPTRSRQGNASRDAPEYYAVPHYQDTGEEVVKVKRAPFEKGWT